MQEENILCIHLTSDIQLLINPNKTIFRKLTAILYWSTDYSLPAMILPQIWKQEKEREYPAKVEARGGQMSNPYRAISARSGAAQLIDRNTEGRSLTEKSNKGLKSVL
jgi:hypothetical protein